MKSRTRQTYNERILDVLVYIQRHLDDALDLDALAAVAHFSPYHFHRIFRGMVGESVKEHVRRLRLERAAHRLKFSEQTVTRIAFEAGYETHEAFTRAFRAMFDQAPTRFRKAQRTLPLPDTPSGIHFSADAHLERFRAAKGSEAPMDVRIERIDPINVAFVRHVGPYDEVGDTWAKLMGPAASKGLLGASMTLLGLLHDDPEVTPPDKLRYDACVVVDRSVTPEGEVGIQCIDGGDYAVTTHRGPYDRLSETYAALCGQWLPDSGRELRSAPGFEVYRNDPRTTAPSDLRTDIHMPLVPLRQGSDSQSLMGDES